MALTHSIRDSETTIDFVQGPPGSRRERFNSNCHDHNRSHTFGMVLTIMNFPFSLCSGASDGQEGAAGATQGGKHVTFAPALPEDPNAIVPSLKYCMDEIEFNKILTKEKRKV